MLGVISFILSIISVIISFFSNTSLISFAIAIMAVIVAVISAYEKDEAEKKEGATKESRALEVGSVIVAAAAIFSYFVFYNMARF